MMAIPAMWSSPTSAACLPGTVIAVRPVGVLKMQDEAGGDEKIVAVPVPKLTRRYEHVHEYTDLPDITRPADPALLRALQGSGRRQVGEGAGLGRCRGGARDDQRSHRARRCASSEMR